MIIGPQVVGLIGEVEAVLHFAELGVVLLLFIVRDRLVEPRLNPPVEPVWDQPEEEEQPVIIAGFGRFGQMVGRVLRARRIAFTALDASAEHVDFVRQYGNKVFYGDEEKMRYLARESSRELEEMFAEDVAQETTGSGRG